MVNQSLDLDRVFHALADGSRRAIVDRLCERPWSVSALAEPFAMSLPAILNHIAVLESAGLVRTEKVGRVRTCHLETAALRDAEAWLGQRRTVWDRRFDALDALLSEPEPPSPKRKKKP